MAILKPPPGTPLDRAHPLVARGLRACWPLNEGAGTQLGELVAGRVATAGDPAVITWAPGPYGTGLTAAAAGTATPVTFPPLGPYASGSPWSLEVLLNPSALGADYRTVCADGVNLRGVYFMASNRLNLYKGTDQLSTTVFATGVWYHLVLSAAVSGAVTLYVNGAPDPAVLSAPASWSPSNWYYASGVSRSAGQFQHVRFWSRALAAAEARWLYTDPWDMARAPAARRSLAAAAAGSGGTSAGGAAPALSAAAPIGGATGGASAGGTAPALALAAPAGGAAGGASAGGTAPALSAAAPAGGAAGGASAGGAAPVLSLSAPAGAAVGGATSPGDAGGAAPALSLSAPVGAASGGASAAGPAPALSLTAPAGGATGGAAAGGTSPALSLAAPIGGASGGASAGGAAAALSLAAPAGGATGGAAGGAAGGVYFAPAYWSPYYFAPTYFGGAGAGASAPDAPADGGGRDWTVLEAIAGLLEGTGEFDGVYLTGLPENHGETSGDRRAVALELTGFAESDPWDEPDAPGYVRSGAYRLTLLVREPDPLTRDRECDRLADVCSNALNWRGYLGPCVPGRSLLSRGRYEPPRAPERRLAIDGEFAYLVDGPDRHDTTA